MSNIASCDGGKMGLAGSSAMEEKVLVERERRSASVRDLGG